MLEHNDVGRARGDFEFFAANGSGPGFDDSTPSGSWTGKRFLVQIPEPGSWALLAGALGLGLALWRRRVLLTAAD